jgi:hypothetical protein
MTLKKSFENWQKLLGHSGYRFSLFLSLVFLVAGFFLYREVISYIDSLPNAKAVGDLLLDVLPIVDLRYIYIYGILVGMLVLVFYELYYRPDLIPFSLKFFVAVFVARSIFISLTHLGPPQGFFITAFSADYGGWPLNHMMHSNDLFFSGHVAYPFMAALITLHKKPLFYFFAVLSVVMGFTVLLMRIHYSIDVFAAYFIVFALYHIVKHFFGETDLAFKHYLTK